MLLSGSMSFAQKEDPVVMTINGKPVPRSEFEYSYNKNNAEGVIDKKTVNEYVELFVNYKLKVEAALDAHLDTVATFQKEYKGYRDAQVRPTFVTDAEMEAEAQRIYESTRRDIGTDGLIMPAHILIRVRQQSAPAELTLAKQRIDSIYNALKNGADFMELAKKVSQDPTTASRGGLLPWIRKGQTFKEFEDQAFALQKGAMSQPFLSPAGYHIVLMTDRKQLEPYEELRSDILKFIEARGGRDRVADNIAQKMADQQQLTKQQMYDQRAEELATNDPEMKYLFKEYHDGLLLFEISNRTVWEKAAKDETGLAAYFRANKKKYKWEKPRFKGIAYHVKDAKDVKAVKKCVKGLDFSQWTERLRTTFNADSVVRIRVEKGIFKVGDNALVDKKVFKKDVSPKPLTDYPIDAVYGKKLKAPQAYEDVRELVTADYQEQLEKQWVNELRKQYPVVVNKEVLSTVNQHRK